MATNPNTILDLTNIWEPSGETPQLIDGLPGVGYGHDVESANHFILDGRDWVAVSGSSNAQSIGNGFTMMRMDSDTGALSSSTADGGFQIATNTSDQNGRSSPETSRVYTSENSAGETVSYFVTGNRVFEYDYTTHSWDDTVIAQPDVATFGVQTEGMRMFETDSGLYAWGGGASHPVEREGLVSMTKFKFNPDNGEWEEEIHVTNQGYGKYDTKSVDGVVTDGYFDPDGVFASTSKEDFPIGADGNGVAFSIIETDDGPKMIYTTGISHVGGVYGDRGLVMLDLDDQGNPTGSHWIPTPISDTWNLAGMIDAADNIAQYSSMAVGPDGNIYMFGSSNDSSGAVMLVVDPATGDVVSRSDITDANKDVDDLFLRDPQFVFKDDYVYLIGGHSPSTSGATTAVYDTVTNTFVAVGVDSSYKDAGPAGTNLTGSPQLVETATGEFFGIVTYRDGTSYTDGYIGTVGTTLSGSTTGTGTGTPVLGSVCFTAGTLIETENGEVPIENLEVGMMIKTYGNGFQALRWIGSNKVSATGNNAPVLFKAGTIQNDRDLLVSQQHRVLLNDWKAEVLFGCSEILVAAKDLVNDKNITLEQGGSVSYYHILFDRHEIVYANGAPSESFHPGKTALSTITSMQRREIETLFPELKSKEFVVSDDTIPTIHAYEARLFHFSKKENLTL